MRYDRRVIGYHGCTVEVASKLLANGEGFKPSRNDWDWLGNGVYFWEFGLQRAYDWGKPGHEVAVVGAIIQLGRCLDLLDTEHTRRLAEFAEVYRTHAGDLPENRGKRRHLDCYLINEFCRQMEQEGRPFDTVRGLFQEGERILPGSEIRLENHIQVVVRRPEALIGLFRPSLEGSDLA